MLATRNTKLNQSLYKNGNMAHHRLDVENKMRAILPVYHRLQSIIIRSYKDMMLCYYGKLISNKSGANNISIYITQIELLLYAIYNNNSTQHHELIIIYASCSMAVLSWTFCIQFMGLLYLLYLLYGKRSAKKWLIGKIK